MHVEDFHPLPISFILESMTVKSLACYFSHELREPEIDLVCHLVINLTCQQIGAIACNVSICCLWVPHYTVDGIILRLHCHHKVNSIPTFSFEVCCEQCEEILQRRPHESISCDYPVVSLKLDILGSHIIQQGLREVSEHKTLFRVSCP